MWVPKPRRKHLPILQVCASSLHTHAVGKLNATSGTDSIVYADGVIKAYRPSEGMQVLHAA